MSAPWGLKNPVAAFEISLVNLIIKFVNSHTGVPVPYAEVSLSDVPTRTNMSGEAIYRVPNQSATYYLTVRHPDYRPVTNMPIIVPPYEQTIQLEWGRFSTQSQSLDIRPVIGGISGALCGSVFGPAGLILGAIIGAGIFLANSS